MTAPLFAGAIQLIVAWEFPEVPVGAVGTEGIPTAFPVTLAVKVE